MRHVQLPIALGFGLLVTLIQFIAVGALNNASVSSRENIVNPLKRKPIIIAQAPETSLPSQAPASLLKTMTPQPRASKQPISASVLPALSTANSQLGLSGVLRDLGDVGWGRIEVPKAPTEHDRPARAQRTASPAYPPSAQRDGIEGYVIVRLSVNAQGRVEHVIVVDSEPIGVFEGSARDAARQFEFLPARVNGVFVPTAIEKKIVFTLQ